MILKIKALFIASTMMLDLNTPKENDLAEALSLYILPTKKHQVHINIDQ